MTRTKRVRFSVNPSSNRSSDADTLPCDVIKDLPSNDEKTSEYAFFKRFKKDVADKYQKRPPLKKNSQPSHSNRSINFEGYASERKMPMKDLQSEMIGERARTNDAVESSYTPPFISSKRPGVSSTTDGGHESPSYPLPLNSMKVKDNTKIFSSTNSEASKHNNQGFLSSEISTPSELPSNSVQFEHAHNDLQWFDPEVSYNGRDIFSMKRAKLQKWIRKTLFDQSEEPSKRWDLVSLLLKRLLPESTEIAYPETLNLRQKERETEFHLPAVPSPISASSRNSTEFGEEQNFDKRMLLKYKESKVPSNFTGREANQPRRCRALANGERTIPLDCGPFRRRLLKYQSPSSQCSQFFGQSLTAEVPRSLESIYGNMNLLEYEGGDSKCHIDQGSRAFNSAVSFPSAKYGNMNHLEYERRDPRWNSVQGTPTRSSTAFDSTPGFPSTNYGNMNLLEYDGGDCRYKSSQRTALSFCMGSDSALGFQSADNGNVNLLEYERGDSRWNSSRGTGLSSSLGFDSALDFPYADYGNTNLLEYERWGSGRNIDEGTPLSFSKELASVLVSPSANYESCSPEKYGSYFHDSDHKKESLPLLLNWDGLPSTFQDKNLDALYLPHPSVCGSPTYEDQAFQRYNPERNTFGLVSQYTQSPLSGTLTPRQLILAEQHDIFDGCNEDGCFYLLPFSDTTDTQRSYPLASMENIISRSLLIDSNRELHGGETGYHGLLLPTGEKYYRSHDLFDDEESDKERSMCKHYTEDDHCMASPGFQFLNFLLARRNLGLYE